MTDTTQPRPDTAAPSVAEIAALTARLRARAEAGAAADPTERARVLADKHALIERITAAFSRGNPPPQLRGHANIEAASAADECGSVYGSGSDSQQRHHDPRAQLGLTGGDGPVLDAGPAVSAEQAAQQLAADGRSLREARALVRGYLDDVSARVGVPAHWWGLDQADMADLRATAAAAGDRDPLTQARTAVAAVPVDDLKSGATAAGSACADEADRGSDGGAR